MTTCRKHITEEAINTNTAHPNPIHCKGNFEITILNGIQLITQLLSTAAFLGSIISGEISIASNMPLEAESFAAVGQWGGVVVVLLVLFAAGVSRLWKGEEGENRKASAVGKASSGGDEEEGRDWSCEVGYAS